MFSSPCPNGPVVIYSSKHRYCVTVDTIDTQKFQGLLNTEFELKLLSGGLKELKDLLVRVRSICSSDNK